MVTAYVGGTADRADQCQARTVRAAVDVALGLLEHCYRLYVGESESLRRDFNQVFFEGLFMDTDGVRRAILNPPFAQLHDRSIGFEDNNGGDPEPPQYNPNGDDLGTNRTLARKARQAPLGAH